MPQVSYEQSLDYKPDVDTATPLQQQEASLVAELLRRNGRTHRIHTATPPGYSYERVENPPAPRPCEVDGPIVQVAAHPGDGPDFFYATYLQLVSRTQYCNAYHEILLTNGEQGVNGWPPARTRRVRIGEALSGAALVGSQLHLLGYPDGGLPWLKPALRNGLVRELATLIDRIQPCILVVHPPKNDHPDHASAFLLTVAALQQSTHASTSAPTLLIHDVEFGVQQSSLWPHPAAEHDLEAYPLHSPDVIVDITATHPIAQQALHQHTTQMYDPVGRQPKAYADLIDTLARVRGLQCAPGSWQQPRGQGFSQIVIPGMTSEQNVLPLRLPAHCLYRRVQHTRGAR